MAGLYFESGIDDGFVKDLKKMSLQINQLSSNVAAKGREMDSTFRTIGAGIATYFSGQALLSFGKSIIDVRAEFQKFGIVLENTLGSKLEADNALKMVADFAANTPFQLNELSDSFIRLTNQGFQPTYEELTKLGDLASSTGKGFGQLTEAIIDAQTGEFERLKEFGIKASKSGDQVTFSFKEQQTTVQNTSSAIRAYILSLGEMKGVAGANAKIAASLSGQISNLADAWDAMLNQIGQSNEGIITDALSGAKYLVEHYKEIAKIIGVLVASYGAYKAAVIAAAAAQKAKAIMENIQLMMMFRKELGLATAAQQAFNIAGKANPYGLILAGIAAVATAAYSFYESTSKTEETLKSFNEELLKEKKGLNDSFDALKKTSEGTDERKKLIDTLNETYKEYLPYLLTEKSSVDEIAQAQRLANEAMTVNIALKQKAQKIDEIRQKYLAVEVGTLTNIQERLKDKSQMGTAMESFNSILELAKKTGNAWDESVVKQVKAFSVKYTGGTDYVKIFDQVSNVTKAYKEQQNAISGIDAIFSGYTNKQIESNKELVKETAKTYQTELAELQRKLKAQELSEGEYLKAVAALKTKYGITKVESADKKDLSDFEKYLNDYKSAYNQYNKDIEGLTGTRLEIAKGEYKSLIENGNTYLDFLTTLLSKEKDAKKQAVIKKEITTVQLEQTISEQQSAQKSADEKKAELDKLTELYKSYSQKRAELEKKYRDEITILSSKGYASEAKEAAKASKNALKQLDDSFVSSSDLFNNWLNNELPLIAKQGKDTITEALSSISLNLKMPGLDPETVLIYKAQIEALRKKLEDLSLPQEKSTDNWKDSLEKINGINSVVADLTSSMEGLDDKTKNTVNTVIELSGGFINVVSGVKAVESASKGLDKASAILALIAAAIKLINKISESAKQAQQEKINNYVAELETVQSINMALLEQLEINKANNEYYSSDAYGTALSNLTAANKALDYQADIYKEILSKKGDVGSGLWGGKQIEEAEQKLTIFSESIITRTGEMQQALGSIATKTGSANWFGRWVGKTDTWESILDVYPQLINAEGELDTAVLKTVLDTAELADIDKTRLENLLELTEAAKTAYDNFGNYISEIFGGVSDSVTDAFMVMYEGGADAMTSLEDSFSKMIESFTQDAIEFALLQPLVTTLNDTTKALGVEYAKGNITAEDLQKGIIESLGGFYSNLSNLQPFILQAYADADKLAEQAGFSGAFNAETGTGVQATAATSVAGQITENITEETGTILAGHLGAIMLSNEKISNYAFDSLEYAMQNLVYMKAIKTNTDFLPEIAENTRKTYQKLESI